MKSMKQQLEEKKAQIAAQLAAGNQQTASASAEPKKGPTGRTLHKFLYEKQGSEPRFIVGELLKKWSTEDGKHSFFKLIVVNPRTGEPSMFDINQSNIKSVFPPLEA